MIVETVCVVRIHEIIGTLAFHRDIIAFDADDIVANRKFFALNFDVWILVVDPLFKFRGLAMIDEDQC